MFRNSKLGWKIFKNKKINMSNFLKRREFKNIKILFVSKKFKDIWICLIQFKYKKFST